ncbi:MFS transporter [Caulobacter sp. RHG1]|uniref:MFS transporter n=1 Tax=Caulobacter sp. (strain RHG1) TaxID=2545762 RepID=UPI001554BCDC|nr:MFS transporter [Caulobacter sp. RHG1]NQE63685.1 hypothetical protein [Caulobacter sp. RHG1]
MPRPADRILFPATILLVGLNLRPALAAIGPVLDRIQAATGLGDTGASLLTSLPVLLMGLCLLGTRGLKARLGSRGGIALGLSCVAAACLGRWLWPAAPSLILTAMLGGVGIAVVQALLPAVIRHRAGAGAASLMGLYSTGVMGGAAIASFASPRIAAVQGWPAALGVWILPAIVGLAVWGATAKAADDPPSAAADGDVWRSAKVWRLLAFFGLGTGAYTLVLAWLPPFYTQLGWDASAAGALLAGVTLAEVAAGTAVSLCIGRFPDRCPLLLAAIGALLVGLVCLGLSPLVLAWPAALLAGLGIGALFPLSLIVAMDHGDGPAEAGLIVGVVQGGGYVLAALLPFAAGVLRQQLSDLSPAWWLMAGLCLVMALIAARLRPGLRLS